MHTCQILRNLGDFQSCEGNVVQETKIILEFGIDSCLIAWRWWVICKYNVSNILTMPKNHWFIIKFLSTELLTMLCELVRRILYEINNCKTGSLDFQSLLSYKGNKIIKVTAKKIEKKNENQTLCYLVVTKQRRRRGLDALTYHFKYKWRCSFYKRTTRNEIVPTKFYRNDKPAMKS